MVIVYPVFEVGAWASELLHAHRAAPAQRQGKIGEVPMVSKEQDLGHGAEFDPDAVFCRMTLAADMAHVFVFHYDGDQPLLAVKSYALDDGFLPF